MDTFVLVVGGLGGAAIGAVGGFVVGRRVYGKPAWYYWLLNALVLAAGIALGAWGLTRGMTWMFVTAVAFMGGGFTGLKYGYEQVIAPWKLARAGREEAERDVRE